MKLFIPRETRSGEKRVAVVPDTIGKLTRLDIEVWVESLAGEEAFISDDDLSEAGARIVAPEDVGAAMGRADAIAGVRPLDADKASRMKKGALSLSFLQPASDAETVSAVAGAGASLISFDMIPRISRAQSMDALTSQALVTGYRCGLVAASLLPKFFPLFMTAAGTVPPAKVLVLGAGVAGLQAIATAKRLGAIVSANDIRAASADEVRSMGGKFIDLELEAEGAGGYAKELSEDRAERQQQLLAPYVAASDVVITTAAVPGRTAPRLVTAGMVGGMKPGSVVVDLAAESGGNVEGSVPGKLVVTEGRVTLWGGQDVASQMPMHASHLYAMNVVAVLGLVVKEGELTLDPEDEIVDGAAVVLDGQIRKGV